MANIYDIKTVADGHAITRKGVVIGHLRVAPNGRCDWSFGADYKVPSRATQRHLVALAKAADARR